MLEVIRNFIELLGQWWLKVDWPWWGVLLAFLGIFVLITSFIPLLKLSIWIVLWIISKIFVLACLSSIGAFELFRGENPFELKSKISYKKTKKAYQFLQPYFANLPKFNFFVWWINNQYVYAINNVADELKIKNNNINNYYKLFKFNKNIDSENFWRPSNFFRQYIFVLPMPPSNFKIPQNKNS